MLSVWALFFNSRFLTVYTDLKTALGVALVEIWAYSGSAEVQLLFRLLNAAGVDSERAAGRHFHRPVAAHDLLVGVTNMSTTCKS